MARDPNARYTNVGTYLASLLPTLVSFFVKLVRVELYLSDGVPDHDGCDCKERSERVICQVGDRASEEWAGLDKGEELWERRATGRETECEWTCFVPTCRQRW